MPGASRLARDELERRWTLQLQRERDHILYQHRVELPPALIRVEDLRSRWGSWSPSHRTITLSTRLIERYPWDVVLHVLGHELAHQIVTDLFHSDQAHGPLYQRAAGMLALPEWAARSSGELPEEIPAGGPPRAVSPEEERLLERVHKLLALAASANEHEALAAMERVQALYAKHNVEQIKERRGSEMVSRHISLRKRRTERAESLIASILIEHYFVEVVFGRLYDPNDDVRYAALEILGTPENVHLAEYVHGFLHERTAALWQAYRERTGAPGNGRRSYVHGVLEGFRDKLARTPRDRRAADAAGLEVSESRALIKVADQRLEAFVAGRHPRLTTIRWSRGLHDSGTYGAGRAEGERLTIHRPMGERVEGRGLALGPGLKGSR